MSLHLSSGLARKLAPVTTMLPGLGTVALVTMARGVHTPNTPVPKRKTHAGQSPRCWSHRK